MYIFDVLNRFISNLEILWFIMRGIIWFDWWDLITQRNFVSSEFITFHFLNFTMTRKNSNSEYKIIRVKIFESRYF